MLQGLAHKINKLPIMPHIYPSYGYRKKKKREKENPIKYGGF